ncbi:MAG: glycosyltransferase [Patescibacteria group bacterium]|nr:glycosyltransferase [Patescibacteria group bacterium]MCL5431689.1 glycosyltransferase [Patescibacteria group bacterium]
MNHKPTVTGHCLVKNEDRFVWFAINSVLPYLDKLLIYDTGSVDRTVEIIKSINSPKIIFEEKGAVTAEGIVKLRNEMIARTKTDWFFLLDGDEVWNFGQIKDYLDFTLGQPKNILATFLHTRNCAGDVYHYRDESSGRYEIAGRRGHLNIRAYRQSVRWQGVYPLEWAVDSADQKALAFFAGYYWHLTHLRRSSVPAPTMGFRKHIYDFGIAADPKNLPEVFANHPQPRRGFSYLAIALLETPLKKIKRKL